MRYRNKPGQIPGIKRYKVYNSRKLKTLHMFRYGRQDRVMERGKEKRSQVVELEDEQRHLTEVQGIISGRQLHLSRLLSGTHSSFYIS